MQRKFLEDLGLEKDVIDKIMGENGKDIEAAKSVNSGDLQTKTAELSQANEKIKALEEAAKAFDGVDVTALQKEVKQAKIDAAVQIALAKNKAIDVDYLLFKAKSSDKKVDTDENGNVTGVDELVTALKTSCPAQFAKGGKNKIEELKLESGDGQEGLTKSDILKKPYSERLEIYNSDPEKFNEIMKG